MSEAEKIIYSMYKVSKHYNRKVVLADISLSYFYGAKIGVLGLNGSGKSTLLRIMAGIDSEYEGTISIQPEFTVGFLEQEPKLEKGKTVKEIVEEGVQETVDLLREYEDINAQFAEPMDDDAMNALIERQASVAEQLDAAGAWDLDSRLDMAMDALRCPPEDQEVSTLSGGERRRVALCRLLLRQPDILLLDEPTNHLDAETVAWLEGHLHQYQGTVIAVTHDRYFLDNVAGWILELDQGRGVPWKGNYSSWLEQKKERLRLEEKSESERQRTLERELEWIRMTPRAKQQKNKARIRAYEELLNQDRVQRNEEVQLYIPPGPRLGNIAIEAKGVSKRYGDRIIFENMDFALPSGGIVGVIGPNGAGKTTLFRLITGQESADSGQLHIGETVTTGVCRSEPGNPWGENTVWQEVSAGEEELELGERKVNSRAYLARFNFLGADQQQKVGTLSGGQRNRVHLAKVLKEQANVFLLDEPTNDLDVHTLRALEEGLENFAGCVVVISHDRWFLDRIATHILAFEGDSQVYWFEGNFSEYEENKKARLGEDSIVPQRVRYRQLTRD